MANEFGFLDFIEKEAEPGPAPKDPPREIQDSDSETDNAERQRFWDNGDANDYGAEGSPNSSFNSSPTLPSHQVFPAPNEGNSKQGGRKNIREELRDARTYGFRKNVERRVFKGSGAHDRDESGNYDPNEEAAANRRPAKKKAAAKSVLAGAETLQYDSQGEEILPSIEEDVAAEEVISVGPKPGKVSKTKAAAAERKKGKGNAKESGPTDRICSSCRVYGLECSILDDPDQFPCTTCAEEGFLCVLPKPKTQEAKDVKKQAFAIAKLKKKDKIRLQKEQKKKNGKKRVQLAAQSSAPKIEPINRKYIACAPCRAGGFHRCSLKTRSDVGPCKRCISGKVSCNFEDKVVKSGKAGTKNGKGVKSAGKGSKGRKGPLMGSARQPRAAPKKEKLPYGMFKTTIKTSFCHPIHFDIFHGPPCQFHTTTAFAMLGLGEPLDVEVYGPKDPSPANPFMYKECVPRIVMVKKQNVGAGGKRPEIETVDDDDDDESEESDDEAEEGEDFVEEEEDPTYICTSCTFERQRILFCNTHSISAIPGLKHPRDFDYDGAYGKITRDHRKGYGANTAKEVKWCSVCVAPAFYKCCVPDRFVGEVGCGLLLCEVCAEGLCGGKDKLKGLLDGEAEKEAHNPFTMNQKRPSVIQQVTLDILVERARNDMFRYEDGIRADAGFLTNDGELKLWMESQTVPGNDEYEETEVRMDVDTGAGATGAAGGAVWHGWDAGMRQDGGHEETIEEYDLRMKLERGKAEMENPAFRGAAATVEEENEDWGL